MAASQNVANFSSQAERQQQSCNALWTLGNKEAVSAGFSSHHKTFRELLSVEEVFGPRENKSESIEDDDDDESSQNETCSYLCPTTSIMNPYDEDRKRRRRDANRRAAKKCRQKKRDEQVRQETAYQNALKQNRELRADIDRYKHELEQMRHLLAVHAATTTNGQCPLAATPPEAFFNSSHAAINETLAAPPSYDDHQQTLYKMNAPSGSLTKTYLHSSPAFFVPSPSESASNSRPVSYSSCNQSRRDSRDFVEQQTFSVGSNLQDVDMAASTEAYTLSYVEVNPASHVDSHFAENFHSTDHVALHQQYSTAEESEYHFASNALNQSSTTIAQPQNYGWLVHGSEDPLLSENILTAPVLPNEQCSAVVYAAHQNGFANGTGGYFVSRYQ